MVLLKWDNYMVMMDQIERWEASAERAYDEMDQGDGNLKCSCGKIFPAEDGMSIDSNPWAMPVCPDCFEGWLKEKGKDINETLCRLSKRLTKMPLKLITV